METNDPRIEVAIEWWSKALLNPKFQTLSDKERSDPGSFPAAAAELMASSSHKAPAEEQINKFKAVLREEIALMLKDGYVTLHVDYHPCNALASAAMGAGIDTSKSSFPWKTTMWILDDYVKVSCGYQEPAETIWQKED